MHPPLCPAKYALHTAYRPSRIALGLNPLDFNNIFISICSTSQLIFSISRTDCDGCGLLLTYRPTYSAQTTKLDIMIAKRRPRALHQLARDVVFCYSRPWVGPGMATNTKHEGRAGSFMQIIIANSARKAVVMPPGLLYWYVQLSRPSSKDRQTVTQSTIY
jgi:hypothetical protein